MKKPVITIMGTIDDPAQGANTLLAHYMKNSGMMKSLTPDLTYSLVEDISSNNPAAAVESSVKALLTPFFDTVTVDARTEGNVETGTYDLIIDLQLIDGGMYITGTMISNVVDNALGTVAYTSKEGDV